MQEEPQATQATAHGARPAVIHCAMLRLHPTAGDTTVHPSITIQGTIHLVITPTSAVVRPQEAGPTHLLPPAQETGVIPQAEAVPDREAAVRLTRLHDPIQDLLTLRQDPPDLLQVAGPPEGAVVGAGHLLQDQEEEANSGI